MRVAFLGTPPEAALALRALHTAGHDVALVVSQPDRRRGRRGEPAPSPVKQAATDLGLPTVTPGRAREVLGDLRVSGAELGVVVAFGQILPVDVLEALPHGFVNVHFSLLPRWRGAAPVERAILAGDEETGVCLMRVEEGLDTGPVYATERVTIGADETAGALRARLADLGARLLVDHLERIPSATPEPQEGEPTYAEKVDPAEFELDWSRPAGELARVVRAGNPSPGAWTTAGGKRLKVLRAHAVAVTPDEPGGEAAHHADETPGAGAARPPPPGRLLDGAAVATGEGVLVLEEVQAEGKRPVPGSDWSRGFRADEPMLGS